MVVCYGWIPEERYLKDAAYEKDYTLDDKDKDKENVILALSEEFVL